MVGHHRPRRRHHDAGHPCVRGLQREVADGAAWVMLHAAHQPTWTSRARAIASSMAIAIATAPGARSASNTTMAPERRSTRMWGAGLMALLFRRSMLAWDPQDPVGIHTPQIRPHQRLRPLLRHGWRNAHRLEQRAREALEIGARNHVHFKFRWHTGSPQQLRRRRISRERSLYERARQATAPRLQIGRA